MKVVTSIAIYAAPIWAEAMNKRDYRIVIVAAYRRSALSSGDCRGDALRTSNGYKEEET